ncbi:MAG: O-antigen ligase family protein [Limisphaerales bacterium]
MGTVIGVLILLLAGAAVWQAEPGHLFQYRSQGRWTGPWDNPNTFGILMGVGVILAVGRLVQSRSSADCGLRIAECGSEAGPNIEPRTSNIELRTARWGRWLRAGLFGVAAGVMGVGLVRSYSRGAWVGAAVGLAYLFLKAESRKQRAEIGGKEAEVARGSGLLRWAGRRWVALAIVCASVGVLAFWSFRQAEGGMVRRAYSIANANDFSWRNRTAAYEGALQMMADRPCFGFGWNQPERVYDQYYRAAKVDEGMAIQLNDYFMLGTTLGIPALACFGLYVLLGLSPMSNVQCPKSGLGAVCRAGALVLVVGFWFDGGLFKLATAAPFWVLLELGRAGHHEIHEAHEDE